ncbi:tRNA guanosine(15) transglycosylase TgtA [Caldiplasma sukawensis]
MSERLTLEVKHREGLARVGTFKTKHSMVRTPSIMPVVNPNLMTVPVDFFKKLKIDAIITNSYIIRRNENLRERALKYGIHNLIGFDGTIMTDSGTFQSYVYGDIEYQNRETVEFQINSGSDISTILDIFSTPDQTREQAMNAVKETHRRFLEISDLAEENDIAAPIQGSLYMDLRRKSARVMSSTNGSYMPIGGVVPLLENYRYGDLVDIILNSKLNTDFSKPVHLFGGGHPMFLPFAVLLGVDMFDSASYVKYARDDRVLFSDGTRDLKEISSFPSWSPISERYTARELLDEPKELRVSLISQHNLYAIMMEMEEIRERIFEQTLWNYVETKARSHPSLYEAFGRIKKYAPKLERYWDLSGKTSFMYYDKESLKHPLISRLKKQCIKNGRKVDESHWYPGKTSEKFINEIYEKTNECFYINWFGMKVPFELNETYPVEQIIFQGRINKGKNGYNDIELSNEKIRDFNLEKIKRIADYQYGSGAGDLLIDKNSSVTVSKSTGRIRTINHGDKIIATLRAMDGFLALTMDGGKLLLKMKNKNRIIVTEESALFNSRGKSVYFKFIVDCDEDIISGNDVLIVKENDELVAVGRSTCSGREMKMMKSGVAAQITHHL